MAIAAATMATHAAHGSPQPASAADSVDSDSAASDDQDSEAEEKSGPEVEDSAAGSDEDSQASDEDQSLDDSDEDDVASDSEASDESAGSDEEPASPAKPAARSLIAKPAAKKPTVSTGKAKRLRVGAGSEDEADASPTANTSSSKKGNTLRKKNRPQDPSPTISVPSRSIPPSDGKLRKSRPGSTAKGRPIGPGDVEDDGAGATGEEDPKRGSVKDRSDGATIRSHTADPFSAAAKQDAWRAILYSVKEPDPAHVVLEEHGNDEFEHSIASPALHLAHFETTEANTFKLVMYQLEDFEISSGGKTLPTQTLLSGQKALTLAGESWHSFKVERVSIAKPTIIKGGTRAKTPDQEDIEAVAEEFAKKDHGDLDPNDAETIDALNAAVRLRIGKVSPEALKEFKKQGKEAKVGVAGTAGAGSAGTSTGQKERKKTVPESANDEDGHDEPESTEPEDEEDEPVAGKGKGKAQP